MSILGRFSDIMKSNINALLDKCEDPAKMIDQTLRDLREDLAEVKKETASVMGDAKLAERRASECQEEINRYATAIEKAVAAGATDDARKLIAKKQQFEAELPTLQKNKEIMEANANKIRQMHDKLVNDIEALEAKRSTIKATAATAKTIEHMNKAMSGKSSTGSIEAFNRAEAKANKMLADAEAMSELNDMSTDTDDLADKYAGSATDASIEAELAAVQAKLAGQTQA